MLYKSNEGAGMTNDAAATPIETRQSERKVILASSLGTVFEWYDFYLYGLLATIISAQFFSGVNETTGFIFALAAFAAGFAVRPFGALVFGRIGDLVGRKNTFLVTMGLMGASTFLVGVLPSYASIGVAAPILLVVLRLVQGLALGGEYGGAATYVAEHAPDGQRGLFPSLLPTTATLGMFGGLGVVITPRSVMGAGGFAHLGASTFLVGVLPSDASIGVAAPILLVVRRLVQGLALGGEYGGAATYVAEHAPDGKRGLFTSFIQTTATLGLFAALGVVIVIRSVMGEVAFADWGWRIPFLISIILLGVSLWIRSEEHTSELQSLMRISYAVFCLKKKKPTMKQYAYAVILIY